MFVWVDYSSLRIISCILSEVLFESRLDISMGYNINNNNNSKSKDLTRSIKINNLKDNKTAEIIK